MNNKTSQSREERELVGRVFSYPGALTPLFTFQTIYPLPLAFQTQLNTWRYKNGRTNRTQEGNR